MLQYVDYEKMWHNSPSPYIQMLIFQLQVLGKI